MTRRDALEALMSPRSLAVVGASPRSFVGRILCENLRALGFGGDVFPVNPRYEEVAGWRCYPSVEDLPETPDVVAAAVPVTLVAEVVRAAAKRGARAAVIPGGGFSETGPDALRMAADVAEVGREFELAVVGPNCMGVLAPSRRFGLYIGTVVPTLRPGTVAVVSQSGSVCEAMVNMGPRVGFSAIVSCGAEAVTTVGDYMRYFAADDETTAVAVFVEGFRDPAAFVEGARALRAAGKPLVVLQAGRTQDAAEAIAAHSGTLAGTDEVVTGMLHQVGAMGVDDLDELIETCELLGTGRMPKGRRMFVVTDSGGEARLIADHAQALGLEVPPPSPAMVERLRARWPNFAYIGNPLDPWGVDANFETLYREVLAAAADEDVDVVAMALDKVTEWGGENELELGVATTDALIGATRDTPAVVPAYLSVHSVGAPATAVGDRLREARVPFLSGLRPALVALRRAWYWQQWRERTSPVEQEPVEVTFAEPGPVLSENASRDILAAYGVPLVPAEHATTPDEAVAAAERLGYPVVIKANAAVAHKAAAGLVRLGIATESAVRTSFEEVVRAAAAAGVAAEGVLVEATASGVELIAGMRHDPAFGRVVLVGAGGALTEVLSDVAVRLCPPSPEDLEEMLEECAAGRLLARVGADHEPVLHIIEALARLALDHPRVREVDVNPLICGPDGAFAADALIVTKGETG